jgi:penicillin-binding protein 1C
MPPIHPLCQDHKESEKEMEIIYPYTNEKIYIPKDFDGKRQKIVAQVIHSDPSAVVYWYINDRYLGETQTFHTMSITESFGQYTLLCSDSNGQIMTQSFEIVSK